MKIPEPKQLASGKWRIQVMVDNKRVGRTFDSPEEATYWASGIKTKMKEADKSFDVNIKDFRGNTALHMACANGHIEMVKYLINTLHVDINIKNSSNNTPLGWAALNGQKEIVKICGHLKLVWLHQEIK